MSGLTLPSLLAVNISSTPTLNVRSIEAIELAWAKLRVLVRDGLMCNRRHVTAVIKLLIEPAIH
jgi:hypothetical protein